MKISAFLFFLLSITTSCIAQRTLSSISGQSVKAINYSYNLKRTLKYFKVENQTNKLSNVNVSIPNLPLELATQPLMKIDKKQLVLICAQILSLETLQKLPKELNDGLFIRLRSNLDGIPLEVSFLTDTNSILTIEDLEKIELAIKKEIRATVFPNVKRYVTEAKFINIDVKVSYKELLNKKLKMKE